MAKQFFSQDGLQAKLEEIYGLSDTDLQSQAKLVSSDLRSWLNSNFDFTPAQAEFVSGIDPRFLSHAGAVSATAIAGRLSIGLQMQLPPDIWSSKYIVVSDDTEPHHDIKAGYSVRGSVTFQIAYY